MLKVIEQNIPLELQQIPQFVCWKAVPKDNGKIDKIPFDPKSEQPASSTNPASWGTFGQAVAALKNGGGYAGIGFVVTAKDPFVGVDLDGCGDPESGDIQPWAGEIISRLNTYTEISPSGKGVRMFLRGELQNPGRRKGNIECYTTGRFLTVTGHRVEGTPGGVMGRQEELNAFHREYIAKTQQDQPSRANTAGMTLDDAELLNRARNAKNGTKFEMLFNGDWTGYPSQSEADQAFCNLLAFWTGCNPDQMERIFRQSGLYREKDDKHPTYLNYTIQKAIDGCPGVYGELPRPEHDFEIPWEGSIGEDGTGENTSTNNTEAKQQSVIVVNSRFLPSLTREALNALVAKNYPPELFIRSGEIVKVVNIQEKDKKNQSFTRPTIKLVNEPTLKGHLARSAQYVNVRKKKDGEKEYIPTFPPMDLVRDIMTQDNLPLPLLRGIVQAPILRWHDGSLFTRPGYDDVTSLFYAPEQGFIMPEIPENPTAADIKKAMGLLKDVVQDFPFDSEASQTNYIAAVLTPVLRDMIAGPVPMLLIDKPLQGTGASLMSDIISIIATGKNSYMTTAPDGRGREEEWRKRITSILNEGRPIAVIDNLEDTFRSPTLCALLTSTNWSDRILGRNDIINLQHRTSWIATGNNIRLAGDLPRRCYKVRLDAQLAKPWERDNKKFKHPHLLKYVKENRGALLAAVYTLARAWIKAGRPVAAEAPTMGSFEEWRDTMGGILELACVDGFLQNIADIYDSSEINDGIEELIEAWYQDIGPSAITTKQLQRQITFNTHLREALPDWLDPGDNGFTRKLGRVLAKKACVFFTNGYKLEKSGTADRALLWKVTPSG